MTDKKKITTAQGFLHAMHPTAPWVITIIHPEKAGAQTFTFSHTAAPGTGRHVTELQEFIDAHEGCNFYFQPNRIIGDTTTSKVKAKHTQQLDYLQVDIDPTAGADVATEQEYILGQLTTNLPKGLPKPTVIVFSGGGYQAFWKLEQPIPLNGDICLTEDAKLYNLRLSEIFDADHCHSVAQLYRLPFTWNIPNEGKIAQGRERAWTHTLDPDFENRAYPISKFRKSKAKTANVSLEVERLNISEVVTPKLEEILLLDGPSDLSAAITFKPEHLRDGDEPPFADNRWESRSERVFFVACALVRAGFPDEKIVGTLMNKDWGVSESVHKQKNGQPVPKPLRYAVRQTENAKAHVNESDAAKNETNKDVQGALKFKCDNEGKPFKTLFHNYRVAVQELGVTVQKDQFSTCYMISGLDDFDGRMTDEAVTRLRLKIEDKFGFKIPKDAMRDLIGDIGEYNRVHPVCDYLNSVNWDGVNRLDNWMPRYLGTPQNDYTKAVGQLILTAAVRRVRKPGCKFDEMVILEGDQGSGKSTALRILAVSDKWFADELPLGGDGKQVMEAIEGKWIIEAAELAGIGKRSAEHLKAMLSRTFDKGRKAYGHFSDQQERQCVFFASHNPEKGNNTYLSDPTGNRRFWPVECGKVDLKALKEDRDQLWAEAAMREARGDSIRLDPSLYHLAAGEQSKREQENPMEAKFEAKMGGKTGRIAIGEMYELLGVSPQNHQQVTLMGRAAKALGWQKSPLTYDGVKQKCYWKGDQVEKLTELVPFRGKDGVWRVSDREQANQANMIPDRW